MELSDSQVRALRQVLQDRDAEPSIIRSFYEGWRKHLEQVCIFGGFTALSWWSGSTTGTAFVLSVLLGCIVSDIDWYAGKKKLWALNREITDWRRVEELLAQNTPRDPRPNKTVEPTR